MITRPPAASTARTTLSAQSRQSPPSIAAAAMDELTADLGMVVNEEHYASRAGGGAGRGETRGTGADDKQIAAHVELRTIGRRAMVRIDAAEPGHGADRAFEGLPARP